MGLLNENPPVAAETDGAGASLLAAPNKNVDAGGVASALSSGFPKVKVGAAFVSFSDVKDPKVAPPCVVEDKLPNIEGFVVVVVDVLTDNGAELSLFSCEDAAKVTVDDVELLSDDFSSDFDCPNVNPPLVELLSVLVEPVPKFIPPLVPNLNPELAAGCSVFLSSLEAVPNLKPPSEEAPNLNPDEGAVVVSLEVVSDEELPKDVPNLNPPEDDDDEAEESGKESPNLNPPDPLEGAVLVLSVVPNLKPPAANVELLDVPVVDEPKVVPKALASTLAPGLAVIQATHCTSVALFGTRHTSHSQSPSGALNLSPNPNAGAVLDDEAAAVEEAAREGAVVAASDAPGLELVQATHFVSSALFCTIHTSHSHDPSGVLNLSPNPTVVTVETVSVGGATVLTAKNADGSVNDDLSPVPGFAVSHATHFTASGLFCTRHVSQSQVPDGLENNAPNPVAVDDAVVEVVESNPIEGGADVLLSDDFEELG